MKKRIIKKGWLLGLLVGLVLFVGASTAMAAYFSVGTYSGNDHLNSVQTAISDYGLDCSLNGSVKIDNMANLRSDDFPHTESGITLSNPIFNQDNEVISGDWSSTFAVNFFTVKAGNGYDLFAWDGNGSSMNGSWSSAPKGTSHMTFFTAECSNVPIPGAVWLLSSGLGLLFIRRRRQRV